ncbi:MAG: FHA domain-containing protein [Pirellulales bacterium]|nr:FHA domain-containing protein [Pirellulales bacterium]
MPSLFVIQGRDQGSRFELEEPVLTIGRIGSNAIQLHDTEVSREHAVIRYDGQDFTLTDLGSSNGTYVNGNSITECQLATGDQVQIGRTLLLFTGPAETSDDLTDQINIVSHPEKDDGSRIVHAMSQSEGSDLFSSSADLSAAPWLARARSNLQVMYRTALAVSHTLDIDRLLGRIMDLIFEWVEADRGCIMLKEPESDEFVPKAHRQRHATASVDRISISKTILDYVTGHNEGVLTRNARDDQRWDPTQSIVQLGIREAICVPMQGRYRMVGVIYIDTSVSPVRAMVQSSGACKFTEEHLKLMIAIGHQAALAVEDTNYYKAMVQAERLAAVGQTIASLSHHIKNVLQGVRGGSYLIELGLEDHAAALKENPINPDKSRAAVATIEKGWKIVERNQERITTLVMDMLTFSKEREPELAPADLNRITREAVEMMEAWANEMDVTLQFVPEASMPIMMFDPEGLHRAILNIINNAIDACDCTDDGLVEVRTELDRAAGLARVMIQDNGIGIEPDDLEQIFKIFVSRKGGRGTGLGLSVSQKIIKEHGGQIRVETEPGKGSTFILELPAILPEGDNGNMKQDTLVNQRFR